MKLATFSPLPAGTARPGLVVDGKRIVDIPSALGADESTATMLGIIRAGAPMMERLRALAAKPAVGAIALADVKLHAPIPRPAKNVFCVGWNYLPHFEEGAKKLQEDRKLPEWPVFFSKAPTTVIGPYDTVPFHAHVSTQCDWEVELGVIIGPGGRDISQADAMGHVWGYTVVNDVSWRDLQRRHGGQWHKGKSLDGSCPMGPWIVTGLDPATMTTVIRVNGKETDRFATNNMIFDTATYIAEVSKYCTIEPGDVMWMGTDGVPENIKPGDTVEIEITGIGTLRNKVVQGK